MTQISSTSATFASTYERKIHQAQSYILRPLFFASIGFAIPIKALFDGQTAWRGIVYSAVSLVAKLVCGAFVLVDYIFQKWRRSKGPRPSKSSTGSIAARRDLDGDKAVDDASASEMTFPPTSKNNLPRQPSLWPVATLLGSAMVARGEISLLIVNVARENSPELMPDELFYLVIWATLLCTIIGPVVVGLIVKRLERQGGRLPATWGPQASAAPAAIMASQQDAAASRPGRSADAADGTVPPASSTKSNRKASKAGKEAHVPVAGRI